MALGMAGLMGKALLRWWERAVDVRTMERVTSMVTKAAGVWGRMIGWSARGLGWGRPSGVAALAVLACAVAAAGPAGAQNRQVFQPGKEQELGCDKYEVPPDYRPLAVAYLAAPYKGRITAEDARKKDDRNPWGALTTQLSGDLLKAKFLKDKAGECKASTEAPWQGIPIGFLRGAFRLKSTASGKLIWNDDVHDETAKPAEIAVYAFVDNIPADGSPPPSLLSFTARDSLAWTSEPKRTTFYLLSDMTLILSQEQKPEPFLPYQPRGWPVSCVNKRADPGRGVCQEQAPGKAVPVRGEVISGDVIEDPLLAQPALLMLTPGASWLSAVKTEICVGQQGQVVKVPGIGVVDLNKPPIEQQSSEVWCSIETVNYFSLKEDGLSIGSYDAKRQLDSRLSVGSDKKLRMLALRPKQLDSGEWVQRIVLHLPEKETRPAKASPSLPLSQFSTFVLTLTGRPEPSAASITKLWYRPITPPPSNDEGAFECKDKYLVLGSRKDGQPELQETRRFAQDELKEVGVKAHLLQGAKESRRLKATLPEGSGGEFTLPLAVMALTDGGQLYCGVAKLVPDREREFNVSLQHDEPSTFATTVPSAPDAVPPREHPDQPPQADGGAAFNSVKPPVAIPPKTVTADPPQLEAPAKSATPPAQAGAPLPAPPKTAAADPAPPVSGTAPPPKNAIEPPVPQTVPGSSKKTPAGGPLALPPAPPKDAQQQQAKKQTPAAGPPVDVQFRSKDFAATERLKHSPLRAGARIVKNENGNFDDVERGDLNFTLPAETNLVVTTCKVVGLPLECDVKGPDIRLVAKGADLAKQAKRVVVDVEFGPRVQRSTLMVQADGPAGLKVQQMVGTKVTDLPKVAAGTTSAKDYTLQWQPGDKLKVSIEDPLLFKLKTAQSAGRDAALQDDDETEFDITAELFGKGISITTEPRTFSGEVTVSPRCAASTSCGKTSVLLNETEIGKVDEAGQHKIEVKGAKLGETLTLRPVNDKEYQVDTVKLHDGQKPRDLKVNATTFNVILDRDMVRAGGKLAALSLEPTIKEIPVPLPTDVMLKPAIQLGKALLPLLNCKVALNGVEGAKSEHTSKGTLLKFQPGQSLPQRGRYPVVLDLGKTPPAVCRNLQQVEPISALEFKKLGADRVLNVPLKRPGSRAFVGILNLSEGLRADGQNWGVALDALKKAYEDAYAKSEGRYIWRAVYGPDGSTFVKSETADDTDLPISDITRDTGLMEKLTDGVGQQSLAALLERVDRDVAKFDGNVDVLIVSGSPRATCGEPNSIAGSRAVLVRLAAFRSVEENELRQAPGTRLCPTRVPGKADMGQVVAELEVEPNRNWKSGVLPQQQLERAIAEGARRLFAQ